MVVHSEHFLKGHENVFLSHRHTHRCITTHTCTHTHTHTQLEREAEERHRVPQEKQAETQCYLRYQPLSNMIYSVYGQTPVNVAFKYLKAGIGMQIVHFLSVEQWSMVHWHSSWDRGGAEYLFCLLFFIHGPPSGIFRAFGCPPSLRFPELDKCVDLHA